MSLRISQITTEHVEALSALFKRIASDPEAKFFHPHPFTLAEAKKRAAYDGSDFYALMLMGDEGIAYGFLRGWEEQYDVPSLGIFVIDAYRGRGAGKTLMGHLHLQARFRGAASVRLRVYPDNIQARTFYEKLGYRFSSEMAGGQLVGVFDL
jgi:GNAT superfamily N-acetyltransferase